MDWPCILSLILLAFGRIGLNLLACACINIDLLNTDLLNRLNKNIRVNITVVYNFIRNLEGGRVGICIAAVPRLSRA